MFQTGIGAGLCSFSEGENNCEIEKLEEFKEAHIKSNDAYIFESGIFNYCFSALVSHFCGDLPQTRQFDNDPNQIDFRKDFTHSPPYYLL